MLKPFITTVALISLCAGPTLEAQKKVILPKGAAPNAGWSYGILIDGTLYVSGMDMRQRIQGYAKASLTEVVAEKQSVMPAYGPDQLSNGDLDDLLSYLTTLRGSDSVRR